jgi:uncharacterized protein (TIGR04222 family)
VNPFDLRGPEFLLFYFLFACAVLGILILLRRIDERPNALKPPLDDPYLVAFLRGGEEEVVRVAALSLVDRGLLKLKSSGASIFSGEAENKLELTDPQAIEAAKRPIEKRVLEAFQTAQPIGITLDSLVSCQACVDYAINLENLGLLPGPDVRAARNRRLWIAIGILLGVAALKILIALSRGRTNILFLIIISALAAYVTSRLSNPFRTARGEKFLQDVRSLFSTLQLRANSLRPGGATTDLVWLASAFGLAEVSPVLFPQVSALIKRRPQREGHGGGDFFHSCGSSSCGGGGCGGGGCGGGGCGGCGS